MDKPILVCIMASSPESFISCLLMVEEKVDKNSCAERLNVFPVLTFILTRSSQKPHEILAVKQYLFRLVFKEITPRFVNQDLSSEIKQAEVNENL